MHRRILLPSEYPSNGGDFVFRFGTVPNWNPGWETSATRTLLFESAPVAASLVLTPGGYNFDIPAVSDAVLNSFSYVTLQQGDAAPVDVGGWFPHSYPLPWADRETTPSENWL